MSDLPAVTVGMPVYNGADFVADALDSWLGQDFTDFELVISQNGSTDGTAEIVAGYAEKDARVRVITRPETVPAPQNFNGLVPEARAPLFCWAAADDLRDPTFLSKMVKLHEEDPEIVLAFCQAQTFGHGKPRTFFTKARKIPGREATPIRRVVGFLRALQGYPPVYGLMKTEAMRKTQLFHEGMGLAFDIGFCVEIALHGRFRILPEVLVQVRRHAGVNRLVGADGTFDGSRHRRIDDTVRAFVDGFPLTAVEKALVLRELHIWSRKGRRPRPWWWKMPGGRFAYLRGARAGVNLRMWRHGL